MNDSDAAPTSGPAPLGGLDPEKLLAAALRSNPVTLPAYDWEPPPVGTVNGWFPEYEVDRLIARGAMGAVYHAVHSRLGREVAIKLLPAALAQREEMAARFDREARALARLNHPNIVSLHDFGRTGAGHPFIVMEYVSGTDLSRLIRGGELPVALALEIIGQVCDALQYAHGQGFVHRDIKPGNILVDTGGRVRIADFGLTKLLGGEAGPAAGRTLTGAVLGTPEYTAPEQLRGGAVDHRADIYSLGVMLYEMLTGDLPRGAWAPPSQRAAADVRLDEVVTRAMQNEPDKRYQQASEVKTAITAPASSGGGKAEQRFHGNAWLAVILFACAAWLAALVPPRHFYFTAQICGPLVLVGLWLLSRGRRPAAWHGLMAGLAVAAVLGATPYLRQLVRERMTEPQLSGKAPKSVPEKVMEGKLAQSKDRTARILSGIDEALRAQQAKVTELESRLKFMRSEYGIADPLVGNRSGSGDPVSPEKMEREMQDQLAIYEARDQRLSGLSGAAAWELIPDDETIAFFHKQRKQDLAAQALLSQSGYGPRHPKMLGLGYSIVKQEEILGNALKEYRAALKTNMANLRQSLFRIQESKSHTERAVNVSPENMRKYQDLKMRHDLAVETLQELKRSATQLTVGALSLFQQEVDSLSRYVTAPPENGARGSVPPPPVSPQATGTVDRPLGKPVEPPAKADEAVSGKNPVDRIAEPLPVFDDGWHGRIGAPLPIFNDGWHGSPPAPKAAPLTESGEAASPPKTEAAPPAPKAAPVQEHEEAAPPASPAAAVHPPAGQTHPVPEKHEPVSQPESGEAPVEPSPTSPPPSTEPVTGDHDHSEPATEKPGPPSTSGVASPAPASAPPAGHAPSAPSESSAAPPSSGHP